MWTDRRLLGLPGLPPGNGLVAQLALLVGLLLWLCVVRREVEVLLGSSMRVMCAVPLQSHVVIAGRGVGRTSCPDVELRGVVFQYACSIHVQ